MISQTSFLFLALSSLSFTSCAETPTINYSRSVDIFSGHFLQEASSQSQNKDKNVVTSPISADIAMSMVALGAEGETKNEIVNSLFLKDIDSVTAAIKKTIGDLSSAKGVTIKVANKIFTKPSSTGKHDNVRSSYRSSISDIFRSEVQQIDFSKNTDAAETINEWVSDKTNHRIKNMINADSLSSDTAAVLINAIYFKGRWNQKFDSTATRKMNFTLVDGSKTLVDMMFLEKKFPHKYSSELEAQILVLPYEQRDVSMVIVLPFEKDGIKKVEQKLLNGIEEHLDGLYEDLVTVGLPKFTIESTVDLKEVFDNLGAKRVFTHNAELTGILEENGDFYISEATQKTFIEVNEEGTEAAAASDDEVVYLSLSPSVICNHPFIFFIKMMDVILFSGLYHGNNVEEHITH